MQKDKVIAIWPCGEEDVAIWYIYITLAVYESNCWSVSCEIKEIPRLK